MANVFIRSMTLNFVPTFAAGVAGNAEKRLKATNDFVNNAFEFEQRGNDLFIFVSNKQHKNRKIANQVKAWENREAKGKVNKKPKPTKSLITYEDLAKWQLRGEFDKGGQRKKGNPGADFFGLSQNDIDKLRSTIESMAYPIMEKSLVEALKKNG